MFGFKIVRNTPPAAAPTVPSTPATFASIAATDAPSNAKVAGIAVLHGLQWAVENAEAHPELIALAAKIVAASAAPNSSTARIAGAVAGATSR